MKRSALLFLLCAAGLLAAFLSACGSSDAIFYTLANERELVDDRGMPDDINVFRMVYDPVNGRVFAAAGTVYWRDLAGDQWQSIAPPAALPDGVCRHIEYFDTAGDDVVAWLFASSSLYDNALYTLDSAATPPAWSASPLTGPVLEDAQVELLKTVNGQLSAAYSYGPAAARLHSLYSFDAGHNLTGPYLAAISERFIDVEHADGAYWVATDPNSSSEWLYTAGALVGLAADATAPAMTTARPAGALYYHAPSNRLYVSGEDGLIHYRPNSGAWTTPTGEAVKVGDTTVRFTGFERAETGYIVVGTQGQGYYSLAEDTLVQPHYADDRRPYYNISGLYDGAVHGFLAVPEPPAAPVSLFAYTVGNGLWRADYEGGTDPWPWVQE